MTVVTEAEYTADHPFEDGMTKVKEVVQELCTKIIDLEAIVVPTSPPKELARREEALKEVVHNVTTYEEKCQEMYTQAEKTWNKWVEDEEWQNASRKVKEVQLQLDRLQESMMLMPIKENMAMMQEQKQLKAKIEELSKEQNQCATIIEPLQEVSLQISMEVSTSHS